LSRWSQFAVHGDPAARDDDVMISFQSRRNRVLRRSSPRRGVASLDYILTLGTMFAMGAVAIAYSRRLIVLAYEVICGLISWPFM
jgi:hypothetical protein